MLVIGWILFTSGFLLLFFGSFVGVNIGGTRLMNLSATISAVAFMISGAIFVGISKVSGRLDAILDMLRRSYKVG